MTAREQILELKERMGRSIIGQEHIVERLLIALLANGNILVEGLPGLAKTRAVKSLAKYLDAGLSRIQFTPDLLPSDIMRRKIDARVSSTSHDALPWRDTRIPMRIRRKAPRLRKGRMTFFFSVSVCITASSLGGDTPSLRGSTST